MSIIEIKKVSKSYNKKQVLNNINITFEENKIYGLLGRNGAGKTTILNLITDRVVVDSGEITIDGENVYENDNALEKIYFMTERTLYPEDFKVKDVFKWTKEFYSNFDRNYALELSKKFSLNINTKMKNLSTGYTSICKIITTLASNAEVLIFDEPNQHSIVPENMSSFFESILNLGNACQTIVGITIKDSDTKATLEEIEDKSYKLIMVQNKALQKMD